MRETLLLFIFVSLFGFNGIIAQEPKQQITAFSHDGDAMTLEIIQARGFIGKLYKIKSHDGYTLSVYHLINPLADARYLNKYPIIVSHGLGADSSLMLTQSSRVKPRKPVLDNWSYAEGDECLAFMLSNNNFDVWLVDSRGTNLLNRDVSDDININQANKFWNFSLDEQALNDVPAQIDFVLEQTQAEKVMFVGYSQSTFFMFALLSSKPEYNDKLAAFIALAPIAYVEHLKGFIIPFLTPILTLPDDINTNIVAQPFADSFGTLIRNFCNLRLTSNTICGTVIRSINGIGAQDNDPEFYLHQFKSTSFKVIKHLIQLYFDKRFGMFDYGPMRNLKKYGSIRPPNYELKNIKLPTIIIAVGGNDFLANREDANRLISELQVKPYLVLDLPTYNHVDFVVAKRIIPELNLPIIQALYRILATSGNKQILRYSNEPINEQSKPVVEVGPQEGSSKHGIVFGKNRLFTHLLEGMRVKSGSQIDPNGIMLKMSQNVENFGDYFNRIPQMMSQQMLNMYNVN